MAGLITGLELETVRAGRERVEAEIAEAARKAGRDPAEVELLAAVKYVALEELHVLQEAGLTLLGENRAQELEAKATAHPDFRWHFIGQLQSRKVKQILPFAELIHSVASDSALTARARPRGTRCMRRSSSAARGPVVSQPERSVSATAAISSSPIAGGWKPSGVARR